MKSYNGYYQGKQYQHYHQAKMINTNILLIHYWENCLKNKQIQLKIQVKQVQALESLSFSEKQLPAIKYFISEKVSNTGIINEIKNIKKKEKKMMEKIFYQEYNKTYNLTKLTNRSFRDAIKN